MSSSSTHDDDVAASVLAAWPGVWCCCIGTPIAYYAKSFYLEGVYAV
jgi:hypothetical protein